MLRPITRLYGFFIKEVNEVVRQPGLILSLILGPFLVLLLFALGYMGGLPQFRVAVVVPPNSISQDQLQQLEKAIEANFTLVSTDTDEATAMQRLRRSEVDLVEVMPTGIGDNVTAGKQSEVKFEYQQVNPFNENWMQYLGATQVNAMNRMILEQAVSGMQQKSSMLTNLPPQTLVSPLVPEYDNLSGQSLSFTSFYAPRVLALILQHIALTLAALSLVRERARGTLEMFRVAPISSGSIILGKYLGYMLFLTILTGVLVALLILLGTPFLGSPLLFLGLVLLIIAASLGIGFLISCISNSDITAVQLSMLMLLVSVFFSGFFLPLENFKPALLIITDALPLTHAIQGFESVMLKGTVPGRETWLFLVIIAALSFLVVQWLFRRQMRRL